MKPQTEDWEEEFDYKMKHYIPMGWWKDNNNDGVDRDSIKSFIRQLIKSEREELIEEILNYIEAEKGCILGGNALTPYDQDIAGRATENITNRINSLIEEKEK